MLHRGSRRLRSLTERLGSVEPLGAQPDVAALGCCQGMGGIGAGHACGKVAGVPDIARDSFRERAPLVNPSLSPSSFGLNPTGEWTSKLKAEARNAHDL